MSETAQQEVDRLSDKLAANHKQLQGATIATPTPAPWRLGTAEDFVAVVFAADDSQVAHCNIGWYKNTPIAEANAAHIVKCVNSFEALRDAAAGMREAYERSKSAPSPKSAMSDIRAAIPSLEAALKLAGEE